MPYIWRVLGVLDAIYVANNKELIVEDIKYLYFARVYKFLRFTFKPKEKLGTAVFNADLKNDGTWWNKFFFVKVESLGMKWDKFAFSDKGMFFFLLLFLHV